MGNKNNICIKKNVLHFVYNDKDISIDLNQLEMVYIYNGCACFYENGQRIDVKDVPIELLEIVMKNSNFLKCGHYHLINIMLVDSVDLEWFDKKQDWDEKYCVIIKFKNGAKEEITLNSWIKANNLYSKIYDKLFDIKYFQELTN